MLIEALVTSLSLKFGSRLLNAAITDENLGRADAADFASALLEALVTGQQRTNADLARIEQKIDTLATNPYHAAMTAGSRLLHDAAPAHRRPEDRQVMLRQARDHFSAALGHAHGRPVDEARAEVMYGLVWAAEGSPADCGTSLDRAAGLLQREALTSFHLRCAAQREHTRRKASTSSRFREAVLGPDGRLPDFSASNRFVVSQSEYEAILALRAMAGLPDRFPHLLAPHGSIYSHDLPGFPIYVLPGRTYTVMDVEVALNGVGLTVHNHGPRLVRAATTTAELGPDGVITPDVSALVRSGQVAPTDRTTHVLAPLGTKRAACLSLGLLEGVDVTILLHAESDWAIRADERRRLRS